MLKRKLTAAALCLVLLTSLTSCTIDPISLLNTIVTTVEVVLPAIPGLSAADVATVTNYANAVLTITDGILAAGVTPTSIAQALTGFQNLIVPQLSSGVPSTTVNLIASITKAVATFISDYATLAPAVNLQTGVTLTPKSGANYKLSAGDVAKIAPLRARIHAAKVKMGKS